MWSYYGRKMKVIKYYDKPVYDTIIEPFAGTAVYSLYDNNWERNIYLIDKYDVIIRIWHYLQNASPDDILKLPDVKNGEELAKINGFNQLLQEEKWLIGFCCNNGSNTPKNFAGRMNFNSWFRDKPRIAKNLYKIKHWKIKLGSYEEIDNIEATWYIDPPYQNGGSLYKENKIDYNHLSEWCKSRNGQVIVCENNNANWLPFVKLKEMNGQRHKTTEFVWYNK